MKLLVTGALRITPEESAELENLGYEIISCPTSGSPCRITYPAKR